MKRTILSLLSLLFVLSVSAVTKQQLRVLYVGGSPEMELMGVAKKPAQKVIDKSVKSRMASFEQFLKTYFTTVRVINARDYTAAMSNDYDVTIFDGKPKALQEAIIERGSDGRVTRYEQAKYLPMDFDRATLCIADASETMGRSVGTKMDWYCLCLQDKAHSWVKDHAIFRGPFPVNLKTTMEPTPEDAKMHAQWEHKTLPEKTEMWTVMTKTYKNDPTYRIGMVSRPFGFFDSPDVEFISSGVCAKTIDAVAIGRHANFFHWGFSASPRYLTPQARAVLANAIVYISKFNGQHPIARKLDENITTRDVIRREDVYVHSHKGYEDNKAMNKQFYAMLDSVSKVAKAKIAKGQKLNDEEETYKDFDIAQVPPETDIDGYFKEHGPELYHVLGTDDKAWADYYRRNMPYFHPSTTKSWDEDIDEDVRSLGIANNDVRLLDRCISMLEQGDSVAKATRLLHRYTLCRFQTPKEWRQWFTTYRDKLFFTEAGGWLWLVNSQDPKTPGNDYNVRLNEEEAARQAAKATAAKAAPEAAQAAAPAKASSSALAITVVGSPAPALVTDFQNPVALAARLEQAADGALQLAVYQKIETGFHTYAHCADSDPFIVTEVKVALPDGWKTVGKLQAPTVKPLGQTGTTIYEGSGVFRQTISGSGAGTAKVTVSYQVCDANQCRLPAEKTFEIKL